MPATPDRKQLLNHYKRLLAGRGGPAAGGFEVAGLESLRPVEPRAADLSAAGIQDRAGQTAEALRKIVEKYLKNDPRLVEIIGKIVAQGGEALRMLGADDADGLGRRPQAMEGLEAIVRTDGSRPSFLIHEGNVDLESSPVGSWGERLTNRAEQLRGAIACVGRIDVPGSAVGFQGTGFLIQDNLILTNRHVLQVSARLDDDGNWHLVDGASIDFGHEYEGRPTDNPRRLKRVVFCGSREIDFFHIDHKKLDLALIELEPGSAGAAPRRPFALKLTPDWAQAGTVICTIGYPGSPPSSIYPPTLLEQLFQSTYGYKRLAPGEIMAASSALEPWTLSHDATTLGGNSGSIVLVFGDEGRAGGLHYGGRGVEPRANWGHVLEDVLGETDGRSSRTLGEILRSFGVEVPATLPPASPRDTAATPPDSESAGDGLSRVATATRRAATGSPARTPPHDWRLGVTLAMMKPLTRVRGATRLEAAALEAAGDGVTPAESLSDRRGYDAEFLDGWPIPLPLPANDIRNLRRGGSGPELKYEHFSVIMSASRRMPLLTACNIDGAESRSLPRVDQWNFDGRLDKEDQWGNELYRDNDADRGHMVRREDPVWGTPAVARRANVDTFHYTNSCPQMAGVNQVTWLGLENYVLSHTREDDMRVCVYTGPIFTDDDFPYRGARIPKAFWKIVAFLTDDGRPSATAYKVSQARELQELEFVFAGYKTFQISVQQVIDATRIDFSSLLPFDGFSQHERVHGVTLSERLESLDQIRV